VSLLLLKMVALVSALKSVKVDHFWAHAMFYVTVLFRILLINYYRFCHQVSLIFGRTEAPKQELRGTVEVDLGTASVGTKIKDGNFSSLRKLLISVPFRSPSLFCLRTAGVEVVCVHVITLRHTPQSVGLLWTRDRPVAETST
jgi:hypothetical protein